MKPQPLTKEKINEGEGERVWNNYVEREDVASAVAWLRQEVEGFINRKVKLNNHNFLELLDEAFAGAMEN